VTCPSCGATSIEDGEGTYTPHYHDCPYRRTYIEPRRTLRSRGGEVITDARWKLSQVNWWLVFGVVVLIVITLGAMDLFFGWLETVERGGR
jgi:hypothetical protein